MSSSGTQLVEQPTSSRAGPSDALQEPVVVAAATPTLRYTSGIQHPNLVPAATAAEESLRTRLLRCGNTGVFLAVFIINVVINSGNVWPQLSVANQSNHPALLTPAG